jgi:hypothetical protein
MFADDHCARFFVSEKSKNLRALAIKALAELHVRRDRLLPPIVFYVSIFFNVAHECLKIQTARGQAVSSIRAGVGPPSARNKC